METVFVASVKQFFSICQIFLAVETVLPSSGTVFLTNSSFMLVEMDFLSSGNSILPFRTLLKFLKFASGTYFKINVMETDFVASGS